MKTILVSGCTRSGLTLMMNILYTGGYPCFGNAPAFEDYEIGKINFQNQAGKAIKLVDTNKQFPPTGEYFIICMKRDTKQQAKSIIKFMRIVAGLPLTKMHIPEIQKSIVNDYKIIDEWSKKQTGYMFINFEDLINKSEETIKLISEKIEFDLTKNSAKCIISRNTNCLNDLLEIDLINNMQNG